MSKKLRIRKREATHKPRVTLTGDGRFKVDYLGAITREHLWTTYPTFEAAINHAVRRSIQQSNVLRVRFSRRAS